VVLSDKLFKLRRALGCEDEAKGLERARPIIAEAVAAGRIASNSLAALDQWDARTCQAAARRLGEDPTPDLIAKSARSAIAIPPGQSDDPSLSAMAGLPMMLLQKWGLRPEAARDEVNRLLAAAGNRAACLTELFLKMEGRTYWEGGRKLAWLRAEADKMADHQAYWPVFRRVRSDAGMKLEAVIAAIRAIQAGGRRATVARLMKATGRSRASITALMQAGIRDRRIVRSRPGVFTLLEDGSRAYVRPCKMILNVLVSAPDGCATIRKLLADTQVPRHSVNKAIKNMRRTRVLAPLSRRGHVQLSTASLGRIRRGEVLRDGHGAIIWGCAVAAQAAGDAEPVAAVARPQNARRQGVRQKCLSMMLAAARQDPDRPPYPHREYAKWMRQRVRRLTYRDFDICWKRVLAMPGVKWAGKSGKGGRPKSTL
jgi:hypothetical protein